RAEGEGAPQPERRARVGGGGLWGRARPVPRLPERRGLQGPGPSPPHALQRHVPLRRKTKDRREQLVEVVGYGKRRKAQGRVRSNGGGREKGAFRRFFEVSPATERRIVESQAKRAHTPRSPDPLP